MEHVVIALFTTDNLQMVDNARKKIVAHFQSTLLTVLVKNVQMERSLWKVEYFVNSRQMQVTQHVHHLK